MLGLEYPGGPAIDRLARQGNPDAIAFPRSYLKKGSLDFSFSGLKTALLYTLQAIHEQSRTARAADFAAGYQEAIVSVLVDKAFAAVRLSGARALAVVGGVSANSRLRTLLQHRAASERPAPEPSPAGILYRQCCDDRGGREAGSSRRAPCTSGH